MSLVISLLTLPPIFAIAGPYEGSQVDVVGAKTDWWGPMAPLLPSMLSLGEFKFRWIVFYVVLAFLFLVSQLILLSNAKISIQKSILVGVFQYLSQIYILTNGRDGIFYALTVFSLSLLYLSLRPKENYIKQGIYFLFFTIFLIMGILFKVALLPIATISALLMGVYWSKANRSKQISLFVALMLLSLFAITLNGNNGLNRNLAKTFPEQQVQLYDLAYAFCWSQDDSVREWTGKVLYQYQRSGISGRDVCASVAPYGWDPLRLSWIPDKLAAPIKQIGVNELILASYLNQSWINLIKKFPEEWIEIKINHVGQVLSMSNSFYRNHGILLLDSGMIPFLGSLIILPARILDNLYLTSLGLVMIVTMIFGFRRRSVIYIPILVQSAGLVFCTITFVANNGRYSFSTVLLSILAYISCNLSTRYKTDSVT
jgi:hypothetical protein